MILGPSGYGRGAPDWGVGLHAGLASPPFYFGCTIVWATYIERYRVKWPSRAEALDTAPPLKGHGYEHRGIHRQRSEVERRGSVYEGHAAVSAVRFFRPGRADPRPSRSRL